MAKYKSNKNSGKTFADAAKSIEKKYPNREKNAMEMKGFQFEMDDLMAKQEVSRLKELAIKSLKDYRAPRNAAKYADGGTLKYNGTDPLNPNQFLNPVGNYQDNRFLPPPIVSGLPTINNPFNTGTPIQNSSSPSSPSPREQTINSYSKSSLTPGLAVGSNPIDNLSDGIYQPDRLPQLPMKPVVSNGQNVAPRVADGVPGVQDRGTGNIYAPLIAGKGIEMAGKAAMLIGGYDKVNPQYNPNEGRIESLMASRGTDMAAIENNTLSQQNVALQNLSDVRSPNVKRALISNSIQQTLQNLNNTKLQENQINNQYKADYANTLNNLGQQRVAADSYAENLNSQSKANYQNSLQNMLASVGGIGQGITDYKTGIAAQELVTSMLSTKDFKAGSASEIQAKLRKGEKLEESDFIKLYTDNGKSAQEAITDYNQLMNKLYGK